MAMEKKGSLAVAFFLLFLLLASGVMSFAEASRCRAKSSKFAGVCFSSNTCSLVCEQEGFESGYCSLLRRICFCEKEC